MSDAQHCDWCLRPLAPEGMEYDAAEKPDRYCWGDGDLLCDEVHEMDAWPRVKRENERLRDLLGKVVASWYKGADTCPVCGQDPCAPSCRLAAALEKDHG